MKFLLLVSLYLFGSARGAPRQLNESPGSLNHPDAFQQFSGEPFSFATPSDREALFETSSDRDAAFSKPAALEHALVGRASGEHISGVQAPAEQTAGGQALAEPAPAAQAPAAQAPAEQAPAGPAPAEPAAPPPAPGEPAVAEQPAPAPPGGEQATGEQPSGSPAAPSAGPQINCHSCSYMDSEGKCLRGEGSCTLQNSQQCMLKKIFEGGKLEFMVQGCENMCPSMSLFSHGTKMQLMCCRDASFCNKT